MSTGDTPAVPAPVERFVAAINHADTDAFVACFTEDGYVDDWGRMLRGPAGVRGWAGSDAIGAGAQMTILSAETAGDTVTTRFAWRSRRFNGESTGIFTLDGSKIAGFAIPPHG
ncbi:nuclear transport factor 2 family protein [Oerskovia flava]|uniref:nuclear transport factor 2 family protein n=1 Tax=Oerskovia flava TaxID=2986422 RepID=UPI00223E96F3|nr:nuclear transport factor 2 family protein [Oerskovia sp. JB1-3-2]